MKYDIHRPAPPAIGRFHLLKGEPSREHVLPDLPNLAGVTCFFILLHCSHLFPWLEQEFRNDNSLHDFKLIIQRKENLSDVARLKQPGFLARDCFSMVSFGAGAKKRFRTLTPPATHAKLAMFLAIKSTSRLILMILSVILRSWLP